MLYIYIYITIVEPSSQHVFYLIVDLISNTILYNKILYFCIINIFKKKKNFKEKKNLIIPN